jgi:hypothetical protein
MLRIPKRIVSALQWVRTSSTQCLIFCLCPWAEDIKIWPMLWLSKTPRPLFRGLLLVVNPWQRGSHHAKFDTTPRRGSCWQAGPRGGGSSLQSGNSHPSVPNWTSVRHLVDGPAFSDHPWTRPLILEVGPRTDKDRESITQSGNC